MEFVEVKGARIPALGMGTWQLEDRQCADAVERALDIGYRHIDTAQMYDNERQVGIALDRSGVDREEIFLTTKLLPQNLDADAVEQSTGDSLNRLGTPYVDLLLIHWPNPDVELERTLGAMIELKSKGKVKHIGVSNFPTALLEQALEQAPIVTNQVEYHPYLSQEALLELAVRADTSLTAYSPLARGRVFDDEALRRIGEEHGKTPGQVALRWLIQQPRVLAVPKATSEAHLRENFDIFDFELSEMEMGRVFGLARDDRIIDPAHAPDWD